MKSHCSRRKYELHHLIITTILGFSICQTNAAYSSEQDGDIIFGKGNSLIYFDVSTQTRWDLFASNSSPFSIDYFEQPDGYSLFWCDLNHNAVYSGQLKNKTLINPRAIIKDNVGHVETIAVDWVAQHLYWVAKDVGQIEVSHFDGSSRAPVVVDIVQPRALAVDPISGWMFWSDLNKDLPRIEKSTMAGEQRSTLFQIHTINENGWLNAIVVDYNSQQLYWVDAKSDSIHTISYDGSNYHEIVKGHQFIQQPFSIALLDGNVIWSDARKRAIVQMNPNNNDSKILYQTNGGIFGITVLHHNKKSEGKNPCSMNNGGCSHLCLIDGLGFKCKCPAQARLLPDNKTCESEGRNPCSENNGGCSHFCSVDEFGIKCHCPVLMRLSSDSRSCKVDDTVLLIRHVDTSRNKKNPDTIISSVILDTFDSTLSSLPVQKISNVSSIDYDASEDRLWMSSQLNGLSWVSLSNSSNKYHLKTSFTQTKSIAWNWLTKEVYIIARGADSGIFKCSVQQDVCVKIISREFSLPDSLTILPVQGIMFWMTQKNGSQLIEGSSLNGTHQTLIAVGTQLLCLTADLNGSLYWIDWSDKSVKKMNPNSNIQTVWHFPAEIEQPVSMGVANNLLFFGILKNILYVVNLTTNISTRYAIPNIEELLQVKVVNATQQIEIINQCLKNTISCPGKCYRKYANEMECQSWDSETSHSKTVPSVIKSSSLRKELIGPQFNTSKIKEERSCNLTCLNNGKCVFTSTGDQLCYCPVLYWGERCEMNLCPCRNGECKISKNEVRCICHKGFSGRFCEQPICNKFCLNGNCSYKNGLPRCICAEGWSGPDCSFRSSKAALTDDCGSYCLNGGSCLSNTNSQSTLKCMCLHNFTGMRCQFPKEDEIDDNATLLGSTLLVVTIAVTCFTLFIILVITSACMYFRYKRLKKIMSKVRQHKEHVTASDASLLLSVTNSCSFKEDNSHLQTLKELLICCRNKPYTFSVDSQPLQELVV